MTMCAIQESGTIELYFYGELAAAERTRIEAHLPHCRACRAALEELDVIRAALATRPAVAGPASGDWTTFMARLDAAVQTADQGAVAAPADRAAVVVPFEARPAPARGSFIGLLATAALLALVALSVLLASRAGRQMLAEPGAALEPARLADAAGAEGPKYAGLVSVGARHLERSKLVVLGLATREPRESDVADWTYERELATSLLNDTRLYRMAAEQRGLTSLAGVMRDLELVLLQTSMAEAGDATALPQIQRLIRKRGLVEKMDVVGTTGLVP
jgi:anti-sigma factor RsiW